MYSIHFGKIESMKMHWITILILMLTAGFPGCIVSNSGDDDSDSDAPLGDSEGSNVDDTDTDTGTEADTNPDPADGIGGMDEACYFAQNNDAVFMWCDTPELLMAECEGYDNNCCCRASCEPSLCESADETVPCAAYDAAAGTGYCDYTADLAPVTYNCLDVCTPRSECTMVDADGSCLDIDAPLNGICLLDDDTDAALYCQPTCEIAHCDDTHYCGPLFNNGVFDGTGACLPKQ